MGEIKIYFVFLQKIDSSFVIYLWILYPLSNLLPDSDSIDKGSYIFYLRDNLFRSFNKQKRQSDFEKMNEGIQYLWIIIVYILSVPFAYITHYLEYLLLPLTKREKGHRKSLHTILGIFLSSLVLSALLFLLLALLSKSFFIFNFIFPFMFIFLGQLTHIICDIQGDWKPSWK